MSFNPSLPIFGTTMSSLTKTTMDSTILPNPFGTLFFVFEDAANHKSIIQIMEASNIITVVLVIEKSISIPKTLTGANWGRYSLPRK